MQTGISTILQVDMEQFECPISNLTTGWDQEYELKTMRELLGFLVEPNQ
jgi:hypothetical protein